MRHPKTGFTLVELAVLMAMTAILAALLIPAMTKARTDARAVTCRSNLKELGLALGMYYVDYDEYFPTCRNVNTWPMYRDGWGLNHAANPDMYPDIYHVHPYQILAHYGYLKVRWRDNRDRVAESPLTCPSDKAAAREVRDPANSAQCRRAHVLGGLTISYNCNYIFHMNIFVSYHSDWPKIMPAPDRTMLSMDWDWWNAGPNWRIMNCIRPWGAQSPWADNNRSAALSRHGGRGSNILWADLHVSYRDAFEWHSDRAFSREKPGGGKYPAYHDAQYFYWPQGYGL